MKNYYLVKLKIFFIDPQGYPDDGGVEFFTVISDLEIDTSLIYNDNIHTYSKDEWDGILKDYLIDTFIADEDKYEASIDGYVHKEYQYVYESVSYKDYIKINDLINDYNKLEEMFD